jgi:hypothetical protein
MPEPGSRKIGAPDWGHFYVIRQIVSDGARDKVQFSLPGDVLRIEDFFALGIIPSARVVIKGPLKNERLAAVVTLGEYSSELTEQVLDAWESEVDRRPAPERFEILVDGGDLTYSQLVTNAHRTDCDCEAPHRVGMQFACHYSDKKKPHLVSDPVSALMYIPRTSIVPLSIDQGHWHPFNTDCHSHWYREPLKKKNRRWYTRCFGPCPKGSTCSCVSAPAPPSTFCWGLTTCWCEP